jgi:hypothetical protein
MHCVQNGWMLTHTKVVIPAPNRDGRIRSIGLTPRRVRELTTLTLNIDKGPVAALFVQAVNRSVQLGVIVHGYVLFSSIQKPQSIAVFESF